MEKTQSMSATVDSVYVEKRLVSLSADNGRKTTVEVSPEVRNLAQVQPGDKVVVRYYQAMGLEFKKKGESKTLGKFVEAGVIERANDLLSRGKSVKEVATSLGYATSGSFATAFRRATGIRPSSIPSNTSPTICALLAADWAWTPAGSTSAASSSTERSLPFMRSPGMTVDGAGPGDIPAAWHWPH